MFENAFTIHAALFAVGSYILCYNVYNVILAMCEYILCYNVYNVILAMCEYKYSLRAGPCQKIFRKAKNFPENNFRKTTFFQKFPKFSAKKSSFLKNYAIPACQGPLPASWAPLFYFFLGVLHPPHPPGGMLHLHLVTCVLVDY